MELSAVTDEVLLSQLKGLAHARTRAGAVATLLVLLPRAEPPQAQLLAPYVPVLAELLATGGGPEEPERDSIQANAAAVLGAVASMTDELHAAVDAAAAGALGQLLRRCGEAASSRGESAAAGGSGSAGSAGSGGGGEAGQDGGGSGEGGGDALSINTLGTVEQLAREQGPTLELAGAPEGLQALLACAAPSSPPAVAEAALGALCAVASHEPRRAALRAAGAVRAAAAAVAASSHAEVLVRALMLLGMLVTSDQGSLVELAEAQGGKAAVKLMGLAAQNQDADIKAIARDLLGLLTRDPELRGVVEAAVRAAAAEVALAAAGKGGAAA